MNSPVVEFYTTHLVDFYNVEEIKRNMRDNNIYVQGDLREYYNAFLKEQEQVDAEILKKSDDELDELEQKYIQDGIRRLFNESGTGLEVPSLENFFRAFVPDTKAMEIVDRKLSESFSEMGNGMKTGATIIGTGMKKSATSLQSQARSIKEQTKTYLSKKILNMNTRKRLRFILQHLSVDELSELEEWIEEKYNNNDNLLTRSPAHALV